MTFVEKVLNLSLYFHEGPFFTVLVVSHERFHYYSSFLSVPSDSWFEGGEKVLHQSGSSIISKSRSDDGRRSMSSCALIGTNSCSADKSVWLRFELLLHSVRKKTTTEKSCLGIYSILPGAFTIRGHNCEQLWVFFPPLISSTLLSFQEAVTVHIMCTVLLQSP